jgi:hypothetical protein
METQFVLGNVAFWIFKYYLDEIQASEISLSRPFE